MSFHCTVATATIRGIEAVPVDVEVDVGPGLPGMSIVGLPDATVQEARERVRSALRACGFSVPNARMVVNLAPGPLKKTGSGFDLPIACALLVATGQVPEDVVRDSLVVGELSLDGSVRAVPGLLAYAMTAAESGRGLLTGYPDGGTIAIEGLRHSCVRSLSGLKSRSLETPENSVRRPSGTQPLDFRDVAGHEYVKRALLLAACGDLGVLMIGPPGSGKTMLARRLPSILPPLDERAALESALIHSVAGLDVEAISSGVRPFRAPHHSASSAGLVGGGSPPRPGEVSLAHNGVLFLDELPEFGPATLQALRQPMEDGSVTLVRADGPIRYPARFTLVAAANPCPCGYYGDPQQPCTCTPDRIARYRSRVGGPLMDRIDISVEVGRLDPSAVLASGGGRDSRSLAQTVLEARERGSFLYEGPLPHATRELFETCRMTGAEVSFLEDLARVHRLSGRGLNRLLRLARTIATVEGSDRVGRDHLVEACGYRSRSL